MRSTRQIRRPSRSEGGHWLSFSDLMSCLLLIFILIMFYIMYQYFDMYEISMAEIARQQYDLEQANADLASQKEKLSEAESQMLAQQIKLNAAQADLTDAESILAAQQAELASAQSLLSEKETEIAAQQEKLDALSIQLGNQQTQINEQQAILAQQQLTMDQQQATMDQQQLTLNLQQQTLDNQQQQIEDLVGLKTRIITSLSEAFKSSNISAVVDPANGSIALESDVLFSTGKYTLSSQGEKFINNFLPIYLDVLFSEEYKPYVAEIIVEGHTDTVGGYIENLKLSQQRALAVAAYILDDDYTVISGSQKRALREVITANGRSFSDPVYLREGVVDFDASRRVVFKFRLTDEQMIQQLKSILEGSEMAADTAE